MMNDELYYKYREQFGFRIAIDCFTQQLSLISTEKKLYSVDEATDAELDALMRESIDQGKNVLLEKFKDKEYTFEAKPNCDY